MIDLNDCVHLIFLIELDHLKALNAQINKILQRSTRNFLGNYPIT